jgi:hypothetical protein
MKEDTITRRVDEVLAVAKRYHTEIMQAARA